MFKWIISLIGIIIVFAIPNMVEDLDSSEVMVVQYVDGTLKTFVTPGWHYQGFGSIQTYPLRSQYKFMLPNQDDSSDNSVKVRFNDGGHASLSGVISWEIPTDEDSLIRIHRKFKSPKAIEQQVIRPTIESAAYTSGPLMSSTQSAAEMRNILLQYMQDQAKNGPYMTKTVSVKVADPITGIEKTVNAAEIVVDNGKPVREQSSLVKEFNINLLPMTINQIKYDDAIEQQITKRQEAIQSVQIAQANALKAEQDAITTEKQGQAKAAQAKWEQEAIKAQAVTEAEQKVEVAALAAKEAEQYKAKEIAIGQGNAERKRLEMQANGALDQKLDAYVKIQGFYADAIGKYSGAWVPSVVMGANSNTTAASGAQQLIDMLSVKTAKDLGIDMAVQGANLTAGK